MPPDPPAAAAALPPGQADALRGTGPPTTPPAPIELTMALRLVPASPGLASGWSLSLHNGERRLLQCDSFAALLDQLARLLQALPQTWVQPLPPSWIPEAPPQRGIR